MNQNPPTVFNFTNYREFIRAFYEWKKAKNSSVSYAFICQRTGIRSKGHFALILQGKANISIPLAHRLAEFMKLRKREADYFQNMVLFNQSNTHAEKKRYFEKMLSYTESKIAITDKTQYEYYDKWFHAAIRAILEFHDFDGDYEQLGKMVVPQISASEAKRSIELLKQLSLIAPDKQGRLRPADAIIDTGPDVRSVALNNTILQTMKLAMEAVDRFARQERFFSGMTLGMSETAYHKVLQELRDFRKRVYSIVEKEPGKRVYQVNIQAFPLSKETKNEH